MPQLLETFTLQQAKGTARFCAPVDVAEEIAHPQFSSFAAAVPEGNRRGLEENISHPEMPHFA